MLRKWKISQNALPHLDFPTYSLTVQYTDVTWAHWDLISYINKLDQHHFLLYFSSLHILIQYVFTKICILFSFNSFTVSVLQKCFYWQMVFCLFFWHFPSLSGKCSIYQNHCKTVFFGDSWIFAGYWHHNSHFSTFKYVLLNPHLLNTKNRSSWCLASYTDNNCARASQENLNI